MKQHSSTDCHMAYDLERQTKANLKPNIPYISSLLLWAFLFFSSCEKKVPQLVPTDPVTTTSPAIQSKSSIDPFKGVDEAQIDQIIANMTLEEKIGQLIIWAPNLNDTIVQVDAAGYVHQGKVSGLLPTKTSVKNYLFWKDSLERTSAIPLLTGTKEQVALHEQFTNGASFPNPTSIAALDSTELQAFIQMSYLEQCQALGIQFSLQPSLPKQKQNDKDPDRNYFLDLLKKNMTQLSRKGLLSVVNNFSIDHIEPNDSIEWARLLDIYQVTSSGLTGLFLEDNIFENERIKNAPLGFVQQYLHKQMGFKGLAFTELLDGESPELKLLQGADLYITKNIDYFYQIATMLVSEGRITRKDLDKRVKRILKAKAWVYGGRLPIAPSFLPNTTNQQNAVTVSFHEKESVNRKTKNVSGSYRSRPSDKKIIDYFEAPQWKYFTKGLFEKSVTCVSDVNKLLPFKYLLDKDFKLVEPNKANFKEFRHYFSKYAGFQHMHLGIDKIGGLSELKIKEQAEKPVAVVLLDSISISTKKDSAFINSVNRLSQNMEMVLVNFGDPQNLAFFEKNITFLQIYERNKWTERYAAQALFGGVAVNGKLPITVNEELPMGASEYIYKSRISFNGPEDAGIAPERLVGIDAIAQTAISKRAFPGCQVAMIKDGCVIYSKSFGHHTYKKEMAVQPNDLYDIASVTKIASTTLAVMKLTERQQLSINGKLGKYTNFGVGASINSIRLKNLLIHNSGLLPAMPISRYYNYKSVPTENGCNEIFCTHQKDSFNVEINPSLYFRQDYQDTIWQIVERASIVRRGRYRYSDLNFFLLQKAVEDVSNRSLDQFVSEQFYKPIGLRHLMYNPIKKYSLDRLIPTEKDNVWRKKLVHGYVHDPAAALMNGVGGNAGLFSNAEDMAVLFQVLANDGIYGGIQYFDENTITEFTTSQYGNHRALGFDKPVKKKYPTCSSQMPITGYGHNGFTGTCVWVDPESDLVYVFLSNRIHPSANNKKIFVENIRSRIHDIAYQAFDSFNGELPKFREE